MDWDERTVMVTGADGFIGSHLVEELLRRGSRVVAIVRRTSRPQVTYKFTNLTSATVSLLVDVVFVDLAGPDAARRLSTIKADTWFHLAADAYVPASLHQPSSVVQANIMSTLNVLEAARLAHPQHVLMTSSSEIYGSHDQPISELHPLLPATPYAASKVACDRLGWSYHKTFQLPLTIVRPFNCYGPRHVYDVIPIFLARALRGEELVVNGSGKQSRDLTYVADTVDAFLRLGQLQPSGEAYNIGTGEHHQVGDLAQTIVDFSNSDSRIVQGPARAGEVQQLQANASKLREATGWSPRHDLEFGLMASFTWMRENLGSM